MAALLAIRYIRNALLEVYQLKVIVSYCVIWKESQLALP